MTNEEKTTAEALRREMRDLTGDEAWMSVPAESLVCFDSAAEIESQGYEPRHFLGAE